MCKCTPEIRTPFCGRGDCLPPGFANLSEWLGEQEAVAQMSLDRVWEQAVQQAMEGRGADGDAELIVRAVNAHEALLTAAKKADEAFRREGYSGPERDGLRAAISLAEGTR